MNVCTITISSDSVELRPHPSICTSKTQENISKQELHGLETVFLGADEDGDGLLSTEEILRVVMSENKDIPEEDFRLAIAGFDYDQDGKLNFPEFVSLMLSKTDEDED